MSSERTNQTQIHIVDLTLAFSARYFAPASSVACTRLDISAAVTNSKRRKDISPSLAGSSIDTRRADHYPPTSTGDDGDGERRGSCAGVRAARGRCAEAAPAEVNSGDKYLGLEYP